MQRPTARNICWEPIRAIREAAARHVREDKVRRLSAAARDRYADLLDRLGQ